MNVQPSPIERLAQADLLLLIADALGDHDGHGTGAPAPLLDELSSRSGLARHPEGLDDDLLRFDRSWAATPPAVWSSERTRLFEGPTLCPTNETAYVRRDKGVLLSDISAFYRAFGFEAAGDTGEKPDHIVAELQFAAMLLVMLARAQSEGDRQREEVTESALVAFADDHLGAWLRLFCERLSATTQLEAMGILAGLLVRAWEMLTERNGLPIADESAAEPTADETGSPYECGRCPAVSPAEGD